MFKEINSRCSKKDAHALTDLANRYRVTVSVSPDNSQTTTVVTFKEIEEGIIGPSFFEDMQRLLAYSALFRQLELENKTPAPATNSQQIPEIPRNCENASTTPAVHSSVITALWSRFYDFCSNLKLNHRGTVIGG